MTSVHDGLQEVTSATRLSTVQGSYREAGARGKWMDKTFAKGLLGVNTKWSVDHKDDTHVVKNANRITCDDV